MCENNVNASDIQMMKMEEKKIDGNSRKQIPKTW